MEVLSSLDRGDVALDLALQTSYPSWGYMINSQYEPATTVWELWESDTEGPHMNSRNHHMFCEQGTEKEAYAKWAHYANLKKGDSSPMLGNLK